MSLKWRDPNEMGDHLFKNIARGLCGQCEKGVFREKLNYQEIFQLAASGVKFYGATEKFRNQVSRVMERVNKADSRLWQLHRFSEVLFAVLAIMESRGMTLDELIASPIPCLVYGCNMTKDRQEKFRSVFPLPESKSAKLDPC